MGNKSGTDKRKLIIGLLKGTLAGLVAGVILILLFSFIAVMTPDPGKYVRYFGYGALLISSIICGIFSSRFTGEGMFAGALSSALYSFLIFVLSFIPLPCEKYTSPLLSLIFHLAMILLGTLFSRGKTKVKKKKRKHK